MEKTGGKVTSTSIRTMSDCHDCRQAPDSTPAPSELSFGRTKLPTDHRLVSQAQLPGHADNHRTLHFRHIASPGQRDISGEFPSSVTHQEAEPGSSFLKTSASPHHLHRRRRGEIPSGRAGKHGAEFPQRHHRRSAGSHTWLCVAGSWHRDIRSTRVTSQHPKL